MVAPALTLPGRMETIQSFKENGGSIAAVYPIHYPRSLFRAFDILPVEVWGPPKVDSDLGSRHLQPYVCSIVRNGLSFLLSGGLEVADMLVIPHTCDSLQGLASIMIDFVKPRQPVLPIYLPRGLRESDLVFLADELKCLYKSLVEITDRRPNDEVLMASIAREEAADALLNELYRQRSSLPLGNLDFYKLIRAREYLPAETFTEMAERIILAPPDPTRGNSLSDRSQHLLRLAESTGALGVIFYDVKFCEPELFDQPILRAALREADLPSIAIEVDIGDALPDQVHNRLESFMEMLN